MIDVRELRLGNYVLVNNANFHYKEIRKVFSIQETVSLEGTGKCIINGTIKNNILKNNNPPVRNQGPYDYHLIYPILLTEELLLKCGFQKSERICGRNHYYVNDSLSLRKDDEGIYFDIFSYEEEGGYITKSKHLHHLQNIYFDLTGKELEIKL